VVPLHRSKDVKIYGSEIAWDVVDWIHLAQIRDQWRAHVKAIMNLRFSLIYWKILG
jgi:hypothetical protein